jgi:Chitin binding Peritrophin-A domain
VAVALAFLASKAVAAVNLDTFCKGKTLDRSYQNPGDCSNYVYCKPNGKARVLNCPLGTKFKQDDKEIYGGHCDDPKVAKCKVDK